MNVAATGGPPGSCFYVIHRFRLSVCARVRGRLLGAGLSEGFARALLFGEPAAIPSGPSLSTPLVGIAVLHERIATSLDTGATGSRRYGMPVGRLPVQSCRSHILCERCEVGPCLDGRVGASLVRSFGIRSVAAMHAPSDLETVAPCIRTEFASGRAAVTAITRRHPCGRRPDVPGWPSPPASAGGPVPAIDATGGAERWSRPSSRPAPERRASPLQDRWRRADGGRPV